MKRKIFYIGIAGKAGSGKDTVAHIIDDYIKELDSDSFKSVRLSLAKGVKEAAASMFNVPIYSFYDRDVKETVNEFWGISYREMAQKVGTEGGRELFRNDLWTKRVEKEAEDEYDLITTYLNSDKFTLFVMVPDIRFEDEATWIRENGGVLLHVQRDDIHEIALSDHASEKGVINKLNDEVISNNDSLEELSVFLQEWMAELTLTFVAGQH